MKRGVAVFLAALAASSVACSGSCSKSSDTDAGAKSGAPAPQKPVAPPILAVELGPGNDDPPPQPPTQAESHGAIPPWFEGALYAPLLDNPGKAYESAPTTAAHANALTGALLLCEVTTKVDPDPPIPNKAAAAPDLTIHAKFGKGLELEIVGPDDTRTVHFGAPQTELAKGDKVHVELHDRNGADLRKIAVLEIPYSGDTPIRYEKDKSVFVCRVAAREKVEAWLHEAITAADKVLTYTSERITVDPKLADWGFARSGLGENRLQIPKLAALVGWADPRVTRRVDWQKRMEERFSQLSRKLLEDKLAEVPLATEWSLFAKSALAIRPATPVCEKAVLEKYAKYAHIPKGDIAKAECLVRITVENRSPAPFKADLGKSTIGPVGAPSLVLGSAEVLPMKLVEIEDADKGATPLERVIAPGRSVTAVYVQRGKILLDSELLAPKLLRIAPTGVAAGADHTYMRFP